MDKTICELQHTPSPNIPAIILTLNTILNFNIRHQVILQWIGPHIVFDDLLMKYVWNMLNALEWEQLKYKVITNKHTDISVQQMITMGGGGQCMLGHTTTRFRSFMSNAH
jgi:hypothetical protein